MNNYEKFLQLHHQEKPLMIANAWNVRSAQIIEKAGFDAVATSSGAIADSLGYADGEKIPFDELLYIVKRISLNVNIPFSVDMERGYTDDLNQLNDHIQKLIDWGVTGINIEDAQGQDIYLKKLTSIKNYLIKSHQKLFINARTDVFLQKLDAPLETALMRAKLYETAGADGLFVTGVRDPALICEITTAVNLPVNVVGVPELSSLKTLAATGVKRISMAAFLYRAGYNHIDQHIVKGILEKESLSPLF